LTHFQVNDTNKYILIQINEITNKIQSTKLKIHIYQVLSEYNSPILILFTKE